MAEPFTAPTRETPGFSDELWEQAGWLPCELSVELPVPGFTVRDLLRLSVGSVVETQWKSGQDVPLHANSRQIGWIEFEAVGESLAVRLSALR
jgi:flagellar motor switch/type III secretory pathway protein FliN